MKSQIKNQIIRTKPTAVMTQNNIEPGSKSASISTPLFSSLIKNGMSLVIALAMLLVAPLYAAEPEDTKVGVP